MRNDQEPGTSARMNLTVGELRERLEGWPDDVPIIVTCESDADPHPVKVTSGRRTEERDDDMIRRPFFELTGDRTIDFARFDWDVFSDVDA